MKSDEFDKMMCEKFPTLYRDRTASMQTTCMCWGFCTGAGWQDLLLTLSQSIQHEIERKVYGADAKNKENRQFVHGFICVADQVKEKFGGLRFYYHLERDPNIAEESIDSEFAKETSNRISGKIDFACAMSYKLCEECGSPGYNRVTNGWSAVRCDKHADPKSEKFDTDDET